MCLNPNVIDEMYKMYFESSWTKDHKHKQRQALFDANGVYPTKDSALWSFVDSGGFEQTRQQSLYVEMTHKAVNTPDRITPRKTFRIIQLCYDAFHGTGDLAFSGFEADSTSKSEWLATRELGEVNVAMESCLKHNASIGLGENI